jgi:hypothetical protein
MSPTVYNPSPPKLPLLNRSTSLIKRLDESRQVIRRQPPRALPDINPDTPLCMPLCHLPRKPHQLRPGCKHSRDPPRECTAYDLAQHALRQFIYFVSHKLRGSNPQIPYDMPAALARQQAMDSDNLEAARCMDDSAPGVVEGLREEELCAVEWTCVCVFLLAIKPREDSGPAEDVAAF